MAYDKIEIRNGEIVKLKIQENSPMSHLLSENRRLIKEVYDKDLKIKELEDNINEMFESYMNLSKQVTNLYKKANIA
jgi:ABC-type enterochelin transport system substrate-binding protein